MPIERIERVIAFVKETAVKFGAKPDSYVFRNNAKSGPDDQNRAYFGFVQPDETPSGAYHDFSLVLFPGGDDQKWIVEVGGIQRIQERLRTGNFSWSPKAICEAC